MTCIEVQCIVLSFFYVMSRKCHWRNSCAILRLLERNMCADVGLMARWEGVILAGKSEGEVELR
ncbi:hypothetical protein Krac_1363 [Ktedonobacter racemifer DSM 44963]|uniref:Uncharacterized protein n=1 Tax=Ktedonobacter racemifer DSM 44963 TaxID=485913 RepID=D6U6Y6_KTERA|nr:hypothetical protein Krac_1363 [Ktedonobacter racemifer DSM 44963]